MPQAVAAVAAKVALFAFELASSAGASIGTAATIANIAYLATEVTIAVAVSVGAALASAPRIPKPGEVQVPLKQPIAARRSAFGRVRVSGVYALFEANGATSVDVLALLDGKSQGVVQWYLNDDPVDRDASTGGVWCPSDTRKYAYGGPPGDRTFIHYRLGLDTETAYSQVTALVPSWASTARGDGVTSMALICKQSKKEFQQEDFPNGLPQPSVVLDAQLVYDPRDAGQTQGVKSTYVYSDNPVLCLLAYLTDANGGMGHDYTTRIFPAIGTWIDAADDCDAAEVTESGTENRYRCAGTYLHDNAPGDVIRQLLDSFDGFMPERGDGVFVLHKGRYVAPTVTIEDRHVLAYSISHYLPDEQATNQFVVSFTDPNNNYNTAESGTVDDTADQTARGLIRSATLALDWVPSASQAIRLAKRRLNRATQTLRGSLTLNLYGFQVLGERYLTLQILDNAALNNIVVEITGSAQIDLANLTVTFPWVAAETTIDSGDPGGSVVIPAAPAARPTPDPLTAPTITALTAVYDPSGSGISGARIQIDITAPIAADVEWRSRWKLSSASDWHEASYSDIPDGASVTLITGFVAATGSVDVQVRYLTAAQMSPWSATDTITLAAPSFAETVIVASQDLAANDFVNVHNVAGAARVRLADATDPSKFAHGFVLSAVATGADAGVHFGGVNPVTVAAAAAQVFLSETVPGGFQAAGPTTSGHILQKLGAAMPGVGVAFTYTDPITRG